MPFFGGNAIRTIETTMRIIKTKYVEGFADDLRLVFLKPPRFHEYVSKGTDSKSTDKMIVYSFIGTFNADKYNAIKDV